MEDIFKRLQKAPHLGLFVFIWSFIGGILLASFFEILPIVSIGVCLFGLIFLSFVFLLKKQRLLIVSFIALTAFGLGMLRFNIKDFHVQSSSLEDQVGKSAVLRGIIIEEPEKRENDIRILIDTAEGRVLASVDSFSRVTYGDEVEVKGKLRRPGVISDDTGREFDYGRYLSKDDVYYTMSFAGLEVLSSGNGNPVQAFLLRVKGRFVEKMEEILAEPESSLLAGLLLSGKQALPKNILEEFKRAGVVHIVVLSGYNITIIAEFLAFIFAFVSLGFSVYASIIGIFLFVLLTGAPSTVVRAAIMASIVVIGKLLRRPYSVPRALLVAAFLMLLFNPKLLVFDPSFQLTYLAVLALVYVEPIVKSYLSRVPEKFGFRNILSTTLATQIAVLPFLLYSMGSISLIAPLSNILILLFIPFTMLLGFMSVVLGFLSFYLALPFAYVSHLLLSYILTTAHVLGNLPYGNIQINHVSPWFMVLSYAALVVAIIKLGLSESCSRSCSNSN